MRPWCNALGRDERPAGLARSRTQIERARPAAIDVLVDVYRDPELPRQMADLRRQAPTIGLQHAIPEQYQHGQARVVSPARIQAASKRIRGFAVPALVDV